MTLKAENWVGEYTATQGGGDIILGGAIDGFSSFSVIGSGVDVYYTIMDGLNKETGIGSLEGGILVRKTIQATLIDGVYDKSGSALMLSGDAQVYGTANSSFLQYLLDVDSSNQLMQQEIDLVKQYSINGHTLSSSMTIDAEFVGARPDTWLPTPSDINAYDKTESDQRYLVATSNYATQAGQSATAAATSALQAAASAASVDDIDVTCLAAAGTAVGAKDAAIGARDQTEQFAVRAEEAMAGALASIGSFGGQYNNLLITVSGSGYQGTITADRLVVESSSRECSVLKGVSVGFNGASIGPNGIDVGSVTPATWYYLFVIYNGSTVASLISLSPTAPTLPSGYTKFMRVGAAYCPAAASSFMAQEQVDDVVSFGVGGIQGIVTLLAAGSSTSYVVVSLAAACPTTVKRATLLVTSSSGTCGVFADNTSGQTVGIGGNPTATVINFSPKTAGTLYYRMTNAGTGIIRCLGYEDRI